MASFALAFIAIIWNAPYWAEVKRCEKLFEDRASGVKTDRPGLAEAVRYARDGDTLTVWKLDRLGRSMKHLIEIVTELECKGVGFRSITDESGGAKFDHGSGGIVLLRAA